MNIKRLPIVFLVVGIVLKATLVLLWRLSQIPGILKLLVYYDPGAHHFAEGMTRLFFYHGGFTFAPGAPISFEIFLVSTRRSAYTYDAVAYMYDGPSQHVLFVYEFTGKERDSE